MTLTTQFTATKLFNLTLTLDGKSIGIGEDGDLGEITGRSFVLRVSDVPGNVHPIRVNNKKDVALAKNVSKESRVFATKASIKASLDGYLYTEYPENVMCVIVLEGGSMQMHEIALVSQYGHFFVTHQVTYEEQMFQLDGALKIERFDSWPQMMNLLSELAGDAVSTLPEYVYQDVPVPTELPAEVGEVGWFNFAQGFGMIRTNEGMARVHWTQVTRPGERRNYLKPGEFVTYERLITPLNTKGRATSFKLEAIVVDLTDDQTMTWLDLK